MPNQIRQYRVYILMFALNLAVLVGVIYVLTRPQPRVLPISTPAARAAPTSAVLQVQVSGAVFEPGVYTLPGGARVSEALQSAGGTRPEADLTQLNLARRISDGEWISVPERMPTTGPGTPAFAPPRASDLPVGVGGRININNASAEQLDALPGIGPVLAKRIVEYRVANGPFKQIEDIKKVKGIGDSVLNDIRDLISIE